jgi:tripartite-type tricarboxylate transporter receptor subunit TctC
MIQHKIERLCALTLSSCFIAGCLLNNAAAQSDYPTKPVRLIVPHPAGGAADVAARFVADKISAKWKQPVLVENKVGAGGNVGAEQVFKAAPDGYTMLAGTLGPIAINGMLYKQLGYDPVQFTAVSILTAQPIVLATQNDLAAKSLKDLVALAKSKPNHLTYASQGNGTTSHLAAKLFEITAGVTMVHVPYQGTSPALNDLMGGRVDLIFDNAISTSGPYRANRINVLAVGSRERLPGMPNAPTFAEGGMPELMGGAWIGVVAPPNTPSAVTEAASAAMADALKQPDLQEKIAKLGAQPVGNTPAEAARFIAGERARWRKVIESGRVTVE